MEVVVKTGAISRAKLQSNHRNQQTNTQFFYRPDALPVAQPTVSKHWREISGGKTRSVKQKLKAAATAATAAVVVISLMRTYYFRQGGYMFSSVLFCLFVS